MKQAAVEGYGARVISCSPTNAARQGTVDELLRDNPELVFIHPSNDISVMSGQGTVALEILDQVDGKLDAVFVPIGGGGLSSGVAMAIKSIDASIQVIGVEPENAADAYRSFKSGTLQGHEKPPQTIADGLRTQLGRETMRDNGYMCFNWIDCNNWPIIRDLVDDILLVSDEEIKSTMRLIWERMKLVVEPSAATATAGLLSQAGRALVADKRVAVVISGGNVDLDNLPWMS